jgi:hypothetical protein
MKLTFKVCIPQAERLALCFAANVILEFQDLKQQKFVIEAEPSESVWIPTDIASNMDRLR